MLDTLGAPRAEGPGGAGSQARLKLRAAGKSLLPELLNALVDAENEADEVYHDEHGQLIQHCKRSLHAVTARGH